VKAKELIHMRTVSLVLSVLAIAVGGLGMAMSFLYLASRSMADITAGTSGFIAGAVLIASGVISLAILSSKEPDDFRRTDNDFRRQSSTDITT
jgi:hypothetical protein